MGALILAAASALHCMGFPALPAGVPYGRPDVL